MDHSVVGFGAVPMVFAGWDKDDIAGTDRVRGLSFCLRPAEAGDDEECLAERMRVPSRAGPGRERDKSAGDAGWRGEIEHFVNKDGTGEPVRRAGPAGALGVGLDFHGVP